MTRYQLPDGSPLVLSFYGLDEWAEKFGELLAGLGCSPGYVRRVKATIRAAVPA